MGDSDDGPRDVWYCKECPLRSECSDPAWERKKPWGYERETCVEMVAEHLLRSGKHEHVTSQDEANCIAEDADYATYEEKGNKRRRAITPPRNPRGRRGAPAIGASAPMQPGTEMVQALLGAVQQLAASGASSSAVPSARPLGLEVATRPRGGVGGGATISMNEHEFRSIIDSAGRARNSADQAHQLCLAAARQFQAEATVMEEVVAHLRGSLRN